MLDYQLTKAAAFSSLFDFGVEHILWHKARRDESQVEVPLVEHALRVLGGGDIVLVEFNPNIARRVLLNPDFLCPAALRDILADVLHLLLDINEEGWVLLEVGLIRVEHVVQKEAVRGSYLRVLGD
jgi:hypothetical protein